MKLFFAILLATLTCTVVWAQNTAQVSGSVKDQTGAVLPGVEVTATQTDTGATRSGVTDETGSYLLSNLAIGPYRLEATLPGFKSFAQTGIVLQVGGNPTINVILEVGQVSDQIEVQADAALVETRSTGVGQVIDNTRVLELPLNGRQATELILLAGAAVSTGDAGPRGYPTISISVGGGLTNGLGYNLDGANHNDPYNNANLPMPFPDALQEFKVETNAVPAQYGVHSAGVINAVTKSGGNELHGDIFEFVRNGVFNARNAFALKRDELKRNQFGGVIGGPIMKNKLFFFAGHQFTVQRTAPTDNRQYVPTAAMVAGDWTAITAPACNAGRQINLRAPFVNNRIDTAQFSKPSLNLLKYLPTTTDPCGEVVFGRRAPSDEHILVGKMDYQASDKHSIFGRYQFARQFRPMNYDEENLLTLSEPDYLFKAQSFVLGDTFLIGANTVSSFRGMLNRSRADKNVPRDFFSYRDIGINDVYVHPGYPKLVGISVTNGFTHPGSSPPPGYINSTLFQFVEDLSVVQGAHQFGFGGSYLHTNMNTKASVNSKGNFTFSATNTGMGLGDFMIGKSSRFTQSMLTNYFFRQEYVGLYFQDTWKASSRFTVNAGLRWEPYLPVKEKRNEKGDIRTLRFSQDAFDKGIRSKIFKNAPAGLLFPGDDGIPLNNHMTATHWMHFAPRFGFAWDPKGDGMMTVRTAYGVFFDFPHTYQFNAVRDGPPWGALTELINIDFADPWRGVPGGNPFPIVLNPDVTFPPGGVYVNIPLSVKMPYVHQWNLSVQRQVGADWLVAGNYIGSSVIHQLDKNEQNPAIYLPGASCVIGGVTYSPCSSTSNTQQRRRLYLQNPDQGRYFGAMVRADDGGTRSYNAFIVSLQRRRSKGVTVQTNYTWSHCIDDGYQMLIQQSGGEIPERRKQNRGNCDSDRRHAVNLSTVYETPQFSNTMLRVFASGWKASGIVRLLSGSYLTVSSGLDNALSGTDDQRPNQVLADPYAPEKNTERYLNAAAFAQPAVGAYGNLGRSNILGPGSVRIDLGLSRIFNVRENQSFEFRAEAFNAPNHMNPLNPGTTLTGADFGRIRSASDPRIIQLALKYVF